MANIKSAEKRIGQTERDRDRNRSQRSHMRRAVRQLREAVSAGDVSKAQELLPDTLKLIDTTAQKKIIHRNAAGRTKSRLSQAVANLETS